MDRLEYEGLKQFCRTEDQAERLALTFELGSTRKAAKQLGLNPRSVWQSIEVIKKEAARKGFSPDADRAGLAGPGFTVRGKSTLHGPDGEVKLQWVKTTRDAEQQHEILLAEIEASAETLRGLAPPTKCPRSVDSDLLAVYPYGDPHLGMYCWEGDSDENHDLKRGAELLTAATQSLVGSAPAAETAVIALLGDFYHSDNQSNRTARSGHNLDVDGRWAKVFKVGVHTVVGLIHLALQKHKRVHVIVEIGNHDDHSAISLAVCLDLFYDGNARVTIDTSARRHHYHVFGQNLIGFHHGDLTKPADLPGVMAADRPEDWGRTSFRAWYTGHIHTQKRFEFPGCEVESFRILAPGDAWTNSMGYRANRSMDCIVHHRDGGQDSRQTVYAKRLDA